MSWLFYPEVLALAVASLCLVLVLTLTFVTGIKYQISYDRLPAAARNSELEVLIGGNEARLQELRDEIKRAEVTLSERDQAEAEAEFWRAAMETAKAEYEALAGQRRETEEAREEYRQVLEELTLAETQLRELKAEAGQAKVEAAEAEARARQANEDDEKLRSRQVELREAIDVAERRLSDLKEERSVLGADVERLRDRQAALGAEHEELEAKLAASGARVMEAESRLSNLHDAIDALSAKQEEIDENRRVLEELAAERDALEESIAEKQREQSRLHARVAELESAISTLPSKRAEIEEIERALAQRIADRETLESSIDENQRREVRLQARIAQLEQELGGADSRTGEPRTDRALDDLITPPACLAIEQVDGTLGVRLPEKQAAEQETDALQRVMAHLRESGLTFSDRTVNAFHTSLKTAVVSPLTVLAGISGTGKSQLPRYYAEALGIHFLKIPVQPRWDSPQDLFGFYNYIEKRYKATDLARALVHLDCRNWEKQAEFYKDRMLLVLLDEMNLARVEYYFSEFLSRLEGRPIDDYPREPGPLEIDIDVTRDGQAKRVYAGQNVLFVGTMNEDESTLSLSDKVLDRANVLRFPKPLELKNALPNPDAKHVAEGYLPKNRWIRSWVRQADRLDDSQRRRATDLISKINDVMNELGRPFGHRMGQAMLHYVANYPVAPNKTNNADQVDYGLADQIEQRIMPRLRGVVVDEYRQHLAELADIADRDLKDGALGEEISKSITRSRETNGVFVWRGFTRRG